MRRTTQLHATVALGATLALLGNGVALADTVTVGPDVTKAPGTTGSFVVGLVVDDNDEDGINGCNAGGNAPVVVTFTSSAPAVVAAPGSVTLTDCDKPGTNAVEGGATVAYAVSAQALDGATATITAEATGGKARTDVSGRFTDDSFVVTVHRPAPANSKPVITVTGVQPGGEYEIGSVPQVGCDVHDAEDGDDAGATAVITGELTHGLGSQTATCTYDDSGSPSLRGSHAVTYTVVDTVAPTITASLSHAAAASGWYDATAGAPTATFVCADEPGSGIASCSADELLTEGRDQAVTGTAVDHAGNTSTASTVAVDIDLQAPFAPLADAGAGDHTDADGNEWHQGSATVVFTAAGDPDLADGTDGSGVATTTGPSTFTTTGVHVAVGTSDDVAGNTSPPTSRTVRVDATAPVVTFSAPQAVVLNSTGHSVAWSATDVGSGLASSAGGTVPLDTSSVGTSTVTIPAAVDHVGNVTAAQEYRYEVGYAFSGLLQPINVDGRSAFKAGSTIPVKFQVVDANGVVQDAPGLSASLQVTKQDSVPDAAVNEAVLSTAGDTGSAFRWDATAKQYVYNLSTKNWSGGALGEGTYRLDVVSGATLLTGGTVHIKK